MLIEFSVTNFLSVREKATLRLDKTSGTELIDNTFKVDAPNTPSLLRGGAIYGANAAGKSNIIKAIDTMREITTYSASKYQAEDFLPIDPFRLDDTSADNPTEFEVTFISNQVRYQYGFAATAERIIEEWLLAYPKGKPQRWIERVYNEKDQSYIWGTMNNLVGQKSTWKKATRPNALFLSTAIQLNNEQLKPIFDWFKSTLYIGKFTWGPGYTIKLCEKKKEKIVSFLKAVDVDIEDLQLEKNDFDIENVPDDISEAYQKYLVEEFINKRAVNVKSVHKTIDNKDIFFDMKDESDGTQKIFALAGPWLNTLEKGHVLFIDELHDNLHPAIVKHLIQLFHNNKTNPKNAQLIITTHDTSILNQAVYRRDQVWFCEKDKEQATKLIPLSDFSPRKGVENIERNYLSGRYGALPYLRINKKVSGC